MSVENLRREIRDLSGELRRVEAEKAVLLMQRDKLIVKARRQKVTWAALQDDTGLTSGAIQGVLRRMSPKK